MITHAPLPSTATAELPFSKAQQLLNHGCLPCFLLSGWSGIPARRCCWRGQTTVMCGCGRSRRGTVKPSRAPRARPPAAKSSLMVRKKDALQDLKAQFKNHAAVFKMLENTKKCIYRINLNVSPGKRAVVGYEDGTVRVWDLKQGNAVYVIKGESGRFILLSQLHFCYLGDL